MKTNSTKLARPLLILALTAVFMSLIVATSLAQDSGGLTTGGNGVSPDSTYQGDVDKTNKGLQSDNDAVDPEGRLEVASIITVFDEPVDADALAALGNGEVIHRYRYVFDGASMVIDSDRIDAIADVEGVTVYIDQLMKPATEVSPTFIGAPTMWSDLGGQESAGEGTIVGILDSGIWPEHPSVSDPDPLGNPFPAPPTVPGSNGFGGGGPRSTCDFGNTAYNPNDVAFTCNNKLIGAYAFIDTYKAVRGLLPTEFDSARDDNGHGSHTMTTAAGNGGVASNIFSVPRGTVSGIAPRAHVIAYRVCGDSGCFQSDSVAAVEQAVLDNVDSINFSISGGGDPFGDAVEIAFSQAYDSGVFVSASAGNAGPGADTVAHRGPWTMTVGASTSDRHFISTVSIEADNGDTLTMEGATVTGGISTPTDVVYPPYDPACLNPYPAGTFSGEIVVCVRGSIARVAKSYNVAAGGAGGLLLYNPVQQGLATDNHFIPSVHLENDDGADLVDFMDTHTGVTGTFTPGVATTVQGDKMAAFSSRGGSNQSLGVSKPDITAPGVQILAGHTPLPATVDGGLPGQLFQSIQGTSMSSPHIAGSGALLADLHPDWTPGQIKSAIMLTANGVHFKEDGVTPADPFDYGSGRVDLARAGDPGLSISDTAANFYAMEDNLWDANYPSLYVPVMPGQLTVQRTARSEMDRNAVWKTAVDSPADLVVDVPTTILVKRGEETTFDISLDASLVPLGETRFATLYLTHKGNTLRFPITIVRNQADVLIDKSCDPLSAEKGETIDCEITVENTSFDAADVAVTDDTPPGLPIVNGSVVGADVTGATRLSYAGSLYGAAPPIVNVAIDPAASPFGYVPLGAFFAPLGGFGDETIVNFNIPAFEYAGELYTRIGMVSNGYAVVGGGTGADVDYINSDLPDAAIPNNTLAPFWTDLNPSEGGNLYAGILTDGVSDWFIAEWENVPNWGDGLPNTFQIWVGLNGDATPGEEIFFTYGPAISAGDGGWLTVGAENKYGNEGGTVYFDGVGTPPTPAGSGYEVNVFSTPGAPGESHTMSFSMKASKLGPWTNCAEMTGSLFAGTSASCISGEVVK